jgi:hypothetical protein
VGVKVQEQLPVGKTVRQVVGGVDSQSGLSDAGHPVDRVNRHHATGHGGLRDGSSDPGKFLVPAGERQCVLRQGALHRVWWVRRQAQNLVFVDSRRAAPGCLYRGQDFPG